MLLSTEIQHVSSMDVYLPTTSASSMDGYITVQFSQIFGVLIHYCASSMVCEFLLLLQALTQYVMCRELRIRVSSILGSKELGQGSKQRCWLLGARSSKMAHHGVWRRILLPRAVLFI
ncbi:hypothetical protein ACQJBY_045857 [Aegilops geniculata]